MLSLVPVFSSQSVSSGGRLVDVLYVDVLVEAFSWASCADSVVRACWDTVTEQDRSLDFTVLEEHVLLQHMLVGLCSMKTC